MDSPTERIAPGRFHATAGVDDWRVLYHVACAYFRTGSFAAGVAQRGLRRELGGPRLSGAPERCGVVKT
jgi:4a-hydroxytetrahydrobiopterin dehydratase